MPSPLVTDLWFKGKTRPKEFGKVTITFEEIPRSRGARIVRPICVSGIVAVGATTGRPSAPEPIAGLRVSEAKNVPVKYRYNTTTGENAYNSGIPDAEKGHIMALELGGPDIAQNIVPQWAKWQGSGVWRRMEVAIKEVADYGLDSKNKSPYYLQFHGIIGYTPFLVPSQAGHKRLAFPSHFKVFTTKLDIKTKVPLGNATCVFDGSPSRNETDDMIAMRAFMLAEKNSGSKDWDPGYDDWVQTTKGKKRDNAGEFAASGQNPRYVPVPKITYPSKAFDLDAYSLKLGHKLQLNNLTNAQLLQDAPGESEQDDPNYRPKKRRRTEPST
jgi:hypothetical protein